MFRLITLSVVINFIFAKTTFSTGDVEVTTSNKFPFQVLVRSDYDHYCAGSIIDEKVVITSAHCLDLSLLETKIRHVYLMMTTWKLGQILLM